MLRKVLLFIYFVFFLIYFSKLSCWIKLVAATFIITGRQLGKFRPKARAKTVKVVSAATKTSDAARDVSASLEPVALDSHSELETEQAHLQPCTSSGSMVACQNGSTAETVQRPKVTQTESGASQGKHADNFHLNRENLCQVR